MAINEAASSTFLPKYSLVQSFEGKFVYEEGRAFLERNYHVPLIAIAAYLTLLTIGTKLMSSRKAFELKPLLLAWNISLAVFSILGAIRSIPELYHVLTTQGFYHSACLQKPQDGVYSFWCFLFVMSKLIELGDTGFIMLRKQNLMFLHWYHHVTVLIFGWFSSMGPLSFGRYIMCMNFTVHSLMYSYYAARCLEIKIPKILAMSITSLQIVQMLVGCFVTVYAQVDKINGGPCEITQSTLYLSIVCYGSYLFLFLQFFAGSYLSSSNKKTKKLENKVQGDQNANFKKDN